MKSVSDIMSRKIIALLLEKGCMIIPEIADEIGASVPTTTKYVEELMSKELLKDFGKAVSLRGPKPSLRGINPEAMYFVGVDVDHAALVLGLVDFSGELLKFEVQEDFVFDNTHEVMYDVCTRIKAFIDSIGEFIDVSRIAAVAINLSGRVDSNTGYSYSVFNIEGEDTPLSEVLTELVGYPVVIENDTRAMAYGEYVQGIGRKYRNMIFVNVSWGLGMGMILDGRLYTGTNGYAGELGHMNVYSNEVICHCGKKGCLETEVSMRAIHRKLLESIKKGESSMLSNKVNRGEQIKVSDVILATNREDPLCIELVQYAGTELGRQLANMINIFNPEAVIIGGAFVALSDYFLPTVQLAIRKYALKLVCKDVVLEPSVLAEKAGIIGAALLARNRIINGD